MPYDEPGNSDKIPAKSEDNNAAKSVEPNETKTKTEKNDAKGS
jgi:hypothetical protein